MSSTVAGIGLGANLLGGVFSAAGAGKQARATSEQDKYQAAVAQINSQIDLQNASYARQQGEQQSQQYGLGAGQRMGQIVAAQSSSGLSVSGGSAVQVRQSQQQVTNMDLDQIRSNAAKTAYDYDVASVMAKNQATLYTTAAADASEAGAINIASSVLSTAGSVSSKWLQGSQLGLFGPQPQSSGLTVDNNAGGGIGAQ
jgi:hypothetical protein